MKEVVPGIFVITEVTPFKAMKPPINIYAIGGDDGLIFDAGYGNRKYIRRFINELRSIESAHPSWKFTRILISHAHPDHFAGMLTLSKKLGLSVMLTRKMSHLISSRKIYRASYLIPDEKGRGCVSRLKNKVHVGLENIVGGILYNFFYGVKYIEKPDCIISENERLTIGGETWEVIPSPGHSHDHISLYNRDRGVLLAGDNILRSKTSWLGPPKSDLLLYVHSLEEYLKLPGLKLVLSAHGSPILDPAVRIREIIDHRLRRIEDMYEVIRDAGNYGISFSGIYKKLYPGKGYFKLKMVEGWMLLTLKYLEETSRISSRYVRGSYLYRSL